jgi:predicted ATPase
MVSAATYRLIEGYFECQSLGAHAMKGVATPIAVYRVLQEGQAASPMDVAAARGLTPLIGRASELEVLLARWEEAKAGQGQVALVQGEAGIGKSRLVQTLKEHVTREGYTRWEVRCSPYHQNSVLYPVIEGLQRVLQFIREESPEHKFHKLEQWLRVVGERALAPELALSEAAPLFAALLSVPLPERYPVLMLTPQKQKEKTYQAVVALLVEYARRQPLLVVWEDLHWADPSTLELLSVFFEHLPASPLLMVLTFRPDFVPPWPISSQVNTLTLHRLSDQHTAAMIEHLTGGKALPAAILQQLVIKTDGVPLFVEEFTKMVRESDFLQENDEGYTLTRPLATLAIPTTLQDSLMARLDRLSPVKEVVQLSATVGREFSYELLRAVAPLDEASLQDALARLVDAEVLYQRGLGSQTWYFFKHALMQETAYQALLRSRRQQYHQRIAQVLAERFSDLTETQPELLAHHYTEAGLREQAIGYWQRAGRRASARSAYVEAIAHLTKGLEVLRTLPETPARPWQELDLQVALGQAWCLTRGFGAPEVAQTFARARALCQQVDDTPQRALILHLLGTFYLLRAEYQPARELYEEARSLAQRQHHNTLLLGAHAGLASFHCLLGEFPVARTHADQGMARYDRQQHHTYVAHYGGDLGVTCTIYAALALWCLGYPGQARQRMQDALTLAQEHAHPHTLAFALSYASWLQLWRREPQQTQSWATQTLPVATEQGFPQWAALATGSRGWALMMQGQAVAGLAQLQQGLDAWPAIGAEISQPVWLGLLAEAYRHAGQPAAGLPRLAEALTLVDATGECLCEAELYRLQGELPLACSAAHHVQPESSFRQALAVARRQQAKSWELRAAMSLARLWQQQAKQAEAYALLAPIYGWFTEGFDTADLQEAKALLEALV